ncbi:class F sortase [Arthrobacter crystallopoietes]|uniref:class F sortase n=1 Tax=Crystallibacter crystallopoietes TaxID=37928 RepID=UPI001ABD9DF1|nr:class F sortase [Arthrobacter crystallopoietes]QTG79488.1 class F sortase [Arthrobacter crystallopoietes]
MTIGRTGRRGPALLAAAAALLLTACGTSPPSSPTPTTQTTTAAPSPSSAAASGTLPGSSSTSTPVPRAETSAAAPEPAAAPVSMEIGKIGVFSELLHLGLQENGTLEVPPEDAGAPAGWYNGSPAPGDPGPAVLLGHVNSLSQTAGVFARLPELAKGDSIRVEREDGTSVVFTVDRGEQYQKNQFPTLEVYGNTEGPELRLITCDGYNPDTGIFEDNYVVYASLAEDQ